MPVIRITRPHIYNITHEKYNRLKIQKHQLKIYVTLPRPPSTGLYKIPVLQFQYRESSEVSSGHTGITHSLHPQQTPAQS